MIGFWLGLLAAGIVVALAIQKPLLARIGTSYATQRYRQTLLVAAGLMFATVVIGTSSIAADSARLSFQEAVLGRAPDTDLVIEEFGGDTYARAELEGIANIPLLAGKVDGSAVALRWDLPFDNDVTGLGRKEVGALGVDPESWTALTGLSAVAGTVPENLASWTDGSFLVNERLAKLTDSNVGDQASLYVPALPIVRYEQVNYTGRLAATVGFEIPQSDWTYLHSPQDDYQFEYQLVEGTLGVSWYSNYLIVFAAGPAGSNLHLTVRHEDGYSFSNVTGGNFPILDLSPYSFDPGTLNITVDSPSASNVNFNVSVATAFEVELEPTVVTGTIRAIVENEGADPFGGGPAVLMAQPRLQEALKQSGRANMLLLAMEEGFRLGDDQDELIEQAREKLTGFGFVYGFAPREELEENAREVDLATRGFFLGMGSFTMAAGFMLVAVLLALLVEERKQMLGVLRATGAQRSDLTRLHVHEGALYAILAAIAGLLGAALLTALLGATAKRILGEEDVPFRIHYEGATLLSILGIGFVLTLGILAFAAYRVVRIHIPSALRNEESSVHHRRLWPSILVLIIGLLGVAVGFLLGSETAQVFGPVMTLFGAAGLIGRVIPRNLAVATAAFLATAYVAATFNFIELNSEESAILVPVRGLLLAVTASVLAAYSSAVHRAVAWMGSLVPAGGAILDNALSHLRQRPGRAALTIAMLSTVLAVMTALGTLFATLAPQDLGATGGYPVLGHAETQFQDARVEYQEHPPRSGVDPFPLMESYFAVPWRAYGLWRFDPVGRGEDVDLESNSWSYGQDVIVVTAAAADKLNYRATSLAAGYGSAREALQAVSRDPGVMVLSDQIRYAAYDDHSESSSFDKVEVGDRISTNVYASNGSREQREITVIAILDGVGSTGAFVNAAVLDSSSDEVGTRVYARPASGVSDNELTRALEAGFRASAMEAVAVKDVDREEQQVFRAIQTLLAIFLGLGILVGMASIALVTSRNALVRRQEVGILRAVGAQRGQILAIFGAETLYVTFAAILIGLGCGLLMASSILVLDDYVDFTVDVPSLLGLYAFTLVAALISAILPAWRASKVAPATAVRYVE